MRKLLLLLRLNRLELFGVNKLLNDPKRRRRARILVPLMALGMLAILGVVGVYCFGICYGLNWMGALDVFPVMMAAISAVTVLMTTIFKASDALFQSRDFDLILSLPIPARTVAAARMLKLYSIELSFALIVLVPAGGVYAWFARPGALFYISYLLTALAVPMIPMVLASLIGVLTAFAGASMRRVRYAGLILSFLVMLGLVGGSFYLSAGGGSDVEVLVNIARTLGSMLSRVYPLSDIYAAAVVGGDISQLLLFVGLALLALLLASWLFGAVFVRLNSFINARRARGKFVLRAQRSRSVGRALVAREWRRYLASNIYVLNTAFGLLLSIVAVVALAAFVPRDMLDTVLREAGLEGPMFAMLPFVLAWMVALAPTTGSSVSMEGKSLWIIRGMPIPARRWLMAKLKLNLQMVLPISLIDSLVLILALGIRGYALVAMLLLPALFGTFSALFGLALNCKVHRFDWTSETKVVKQSWGASLPVFLVMGLAFGGGYLTARVSAMDHMLVPLLFAAALAAASAALWILIRAKAEKWASRM
ncbi:MAG: hypothetical protein GX647_04185 [Clostridiales bacterium]|nr:hypothetical protein [Clostridiales bacterium]